MLRYRLDEGGPGGVLYAKVYADGLGEVQRRAATELSQAAGAPGGACGVATYLAYHDAERVA